MKTLTIMGMAMGLVFCFITGCASDDDPDECEIYCKEITDCSEMMDQPFSNARCERNCHDDLQAYHLIGCEDDFLDLLDCRSDLSCTDENDLGDRCADEIDDLNRCID